MSRVDSKYERKPDDLYETPRWVVDAVVPHLPPGDRIWEPACGSGNIARALRNHGYRVYATDKADGPDFFTFNSILAVNGIVTNPPYECLNRFVQHAIDLMRAHLGFVALLLPSDVDSARTRRHLFADCPIFAKTIVLTKRIVWFERTDGKKAAPSENHRWFIWDWRHDGPPITRYEP